MISFYNYFNFFYLNKKFFVNIIKKFISFKNLYNKKILVFVINSLNNTKIDIKNSINFFLSFKVFKINTLISKKIKKTYIYF